MNVFDLNKNIIIGYNEIVIKKSLSFNNPNISIYFNNKKIIILSNKIDNFTYKINFNISNKGKTILIIKDVDVEEEYKLIFDYNIDNFIKQPEYNLEYFYNKDKVYLILKSHYPLKKDIDLKFEGDFNKIVYWRKDSKKIEISFPYQILGISLINFKLNNKLYKIKVINKEDFPKNFILVKGGIKLNKPCNFNLIIKTNKKEFEIKKGEIYLILDFDEIDNLKLYFEDIFIFEQKIVNIKYLPKITILENPLRIRISQIYYADVKIKFKNKEDIWIIPQGKTEVYLNYSSGIKLLEIEEIINASCDNNSGIFLIK